MESSTCTAAGSNREVVLAVFSTPLLVGTCNGVLEAGGVGGVTVAVAVAAYEALTK